MSRGCGKLQKAALSFVVNAKRPVTYTEMVGELLQASGVNDPTAKFQPDRERAIRRALKGLCDRDLLSTLGSGRPGDPYRYTIEATCVLCREEIPDGRGLMTKKGDVICHKCAGAVAHAYATLTIEDLAAAVDTKAEA